MKSTPGMLLEVLSSYVYRQEYNVLVPIIKMLAGISLFNFYRAILQLTIERDAIVCEIACKSEVGFLSEEQAAPETVCNGSKSASLALRYRRRKM